VKIEALMMMPRMMMPMTFSKTIMQAVVVSKLCGPPRHSSYKQILEETTTTMILWKETAVLSMMKMNDATTLFGR
jgi:hypothetical protein